MGEELEKGFIKVFEKLLKGGSNPTKCLDKDKFPIFYKKNAKALIIRTY